MCDVCCALCAGHFTLTSMTESSEVQGPDPCAAACISAQEHFVTSTHPVRDRCRTVDISLTLHGYHDTCTMTQRGQCYAHRDVKEKEQGCDRNVTEK
jgi:hypothetical protein